jgi:amino acid transporter
LNLYDKLFRKKSVDAILKDIEVQGSEHGGGMHRNLRTRDLVAFGIAAIIGAGIFSTVGKASADGGPAVILLFIFTAIACTFAGLAYAEFASMIPISGSAYTYSYAAFGEIVAWIIGWDLLIEYAIGNVAVAVSWSDYFTGLLGDIQIPALGLENGIQVSHWLTMDYFSAHKGYEAALASKGPTEMMEHFTQFSAWHSAPRIGGLRLVCDLPALFITAIITTVIYVGIKESKRANNMLVLLKMLILVLVLGVGAFFVHPGNWNPFMPHGMGGVLKGVAAVFFAYIGFDAISTTAEECRNPQRDLPRGIIWSLVISTILYVVIALVLTGMVPYSKLGVGDPLRFVFDEQINQGHAPESIKWILLVVGIGAVIAVASVLLVFQMGQPRIWMSMSRDGLLPPIFGRIHPKFKTPSFSTILTGFMVGIPALFMNLEELVNLTSIGTLFAFVLVCAGVLKLNTQKNPPKSKFKSPYINGRYFAPLIFIGTVVALSVVKDGWHNSFFVGAHEAEDLGEKEGAFKIPMLLFFVGFAFSTVLAVIKKFSLFPWLGLVSSLFMMAQLSWSNWLRFGIWLLIGLVIYFLYGFSKSKLAKPKVHP